ncbi:MAG: DinB family protein [Bacteroidota bacterium]
MTFQPDFSEANEFYHGYLRLTKDAPLVGQLQEGAQATLSLLGNLPEDRWQFSYAPGKWTLAESFLHLIDAERVFTYRALSIARGDTAALPGFNQDDYVPLSGAAHRKGADLLAEYQAVRQASIQLFAHLDEAAMARMGTASGHPISAKALGFILAGHEQHHLNLFREKYLAT